MTVFGSRSFEFKPQVVQNEHCCQPSCFPVHLFVAKNSLDPTHRCAAAIILTLLLFYCFYIVFYVFFFCFCFLFFVFIYVQHFVPAVAV